jgi:hypothetical protein
MKMQFFFSKKAVVATIIGTFLGWLIFTLGRQNINVSERMILKWYDEIRRLINLELDDENPIFTEIKDDLNRRIINDEELLKHRVRADVTYALSEYRRAERYMPKPPPNNKNKETYEKLVGTERVIVEDAEYYEYKDGSMGIRGVWVQPPEKPLLIEKDPNLRKWAFSNESMIKDVGSPKQKEILRQSSLPEEVE